MPGPHPILAVARVRPSRYRPRKTACGQEAYVLYSGFYIAPGSMLFESYHLIATSVPIRVHGMVPVVLEWQEIA